MLNFILGTIVGSFLTVGVIIIFMASKDRKEYDHKGDRDET